MKADLRTINYQAKENRYLKLVAKRISEMAEDAARYYSVRPEQNPQREQVLLSISLALRKVSCGFSRDAAGILRACLDNLPENLVRGEDPKK